jgi:hypothetical protein
MPLIRKFARQGHAVPRGPYRPHGPFPLEILAQASVVHETYSSDSLHEALDDIRMFKCNLCGEVLYEDELDNHDCESEN